MLVLPPLNYRQSVTWSLPDGLDAIGSPRGRVTLSLTLKVVIFDLSGWTEAALLSGRRGGCSSSTNVLVLVARGDAASVGRGAGGARANGRVSAT